ncbi:TPA: shufflon system plasmid conjugative transfer pilus tip adhesin PilV [Escherichia coli]|nr:shufflon system plasmid conjugative transfer pilus tip adhesin PilV [Escherichia coli]HDK1132706.1 shufflon system plasmid conjugative transfer pilus tip adhesin PilV [Escherichia coli]HDK1150860.1 shufflon system plasmid conjugative transfer pilus tip adhesin PilV [Escherichia coli]
MAVGFLIVGLALTMLYRSSEDSNNNVVARQATSWATAAKLYIAANYDSLLASAPTTISRSTLVNSGYLNSGEPETNLFQQTWKVAVRKNTRNSDQLDAVLLSSGGQPMDYPTLRYIAAAIDGYGGFVYSGSMPSGCTSSTTTVNGAACGWTLDLSGFGISTTSGHIAVNLGADIAGSASNGGDFLHRYSVPGHAEYNQMNTALDMNGKNVNRAGNLLVTSDGKSSDDHGSSGSTGFVGWASGSASGTASDATSLRAGLYFSTSAPSSSDKESVWIKTTSNTSLDVTGKVRAATVKGTRLITSEGYLMPGKTVTANTSCTPAALGISDLLADTTGLVAHDSTGATLSCQSGIWKKNASGSTVLTGRIANGQQIPLPSGFSASQCSWSVSNAENPHGWKPNYFAGSVATYDSNRIVTCGYYDEYNFHSGTNRTDLTGKCSYVVTCQS